LQLTQRRQVEVFVEVFVLFVQISLQDGPRTAAEQWRRREAIIPLYAA
jgi:hypothetical protein